jgi:hypothetical protein
MGGHAWWYAVPYQKNVEQAMLELREREFTAGRYNPVTRYPAFPDTDRAPAVGARHRSIDEAMEATDADGSRSILDMYQMGTAPEPATMCPVSENELMEFFGTTRPTREQVLESDAFFESIGRGEGRYIVLYDGKTPKEIVFVGYSFD